MTQDADPILRVAHKGAIVVSPRRFAALVTDIGMSVVDGEVAAELVDRLKSPMRESEVIRLVAADGQGDPEQVTTVLTQLKARGIVRVAESESEPTAAEVYRESWKPTNGSVRLSSVGQAPRAIVELALSELGLGVQGEIGSDVHVVVVDDYLSPELAEIVDDDTPTLLAQLSGPRPTIGPWLGQGGPCIECLQARLRFNRARELALLEEGDLGPVSRGWTTASAHHGAAEIAWEVHRFASGRRRIGSHSTMSVVHHSSGETKAHTVVRRPHCSRCGEPFTLDSPHWDVKIPQVSLVELDDGSMRALTPEQTLDKYRHLVSSRTGVVEYLSDADPSDNPVHVVESGTNHALVRPGSGNQGFRQRAGGKGTTSTQARAGALAEAIERLSAVYTGEQPVHTSLLADVVRDAIDPQAMLLFSDKQYANRTERNEESDPHSWIPEPFNPTEPVEWVPAWSMRAQERRWVPAALTYYGYSQEKGIRWGSADSNGNASGTSMADAIEQGFFELVERDAVALWWYNRVRRPGVDVESLTDVYTNPYPVQLRNYYRENLDRDVYLLDVTTDAGIPAIVAVSLALHDKPRVMLGFGCHHNPSVAANRALTELNQFLRMSFALDKNASKLDSTVARWWMREDLDDQCQIEPMSVESVEDRFELLRDTRSASSRDVVDACTEVAERVGSELVVVNLTQPDIGMPVVKVIVPGLRHFWPRFAPGRLFDVPVALGWLDAANTEETLNPTPIFW